MGGGGSAPAPDPNVGKAALLSAQTGVDMLAFAKEQFAIEQPRMQELHELTTRATQAQMAISEKQDGWATADRERYETTFRPLEDKMVEKANEWNAPQKAEQEAAKARADVSAALSAQKDQTLRESAALGISPDSGRFSGMQRAQELGGALATVGAENQAREQARAKGDAYTADVVNLGRGVVTQSNQATGLSLGASGQAVGLKQNSQQVANQSSAVVERGFQGQMQGYQQQGNLLNADYQNRLSAWKANNENSSGIGKFLGTAIGFGASFLSDENAKTNKEPIPDGEALTAMRNLPVEEWDYKPGEGDGGHHIGTYAQDFHKQTGKGNGMSINVQDAIGLTMKAVQDLATKVDKIAGSPKTKPKSKLKTEAANIARTKDEALPTGLDMDKEYS